MQLTLEDKCKVDYYIKVINLYLHKCNESKYKDHILDNLFNNLSIDINIKLLIIKEFFTIEEFTIYLKNTTRIVYFLNNNIDEFTPDNYEVVIYDSIVDNIDKIIVSYLPSYNDITVPLNTIERNIDKISCLNNLCNCSNITLQFIERYIDKFTKLNSLCCNPIVTLEFIERYIDKFTNLDALCNKPIVTLEFIEQHIDKFDKLDSLCSNPIVTIEFIERHIDKFDKLIFLCAKPLPDRTIEGRDNTIVTLDFIERYIDKFMYGYNNLDYLMSTSLVTCDFVERHIDKFTEYYFPNITLEFIERHLDIFTTKDWYYIIRLPFMNTDFLERNIDVITSPELFKKTLFKKPKSKRSYNSSIHLSNIINTDLDTSCNTHWTYYIKKYKELNKLDNSIKYIDNKFIYKYIYEKNITIFLLNNPNFTIDKLIRISKFFNSKYENTYQDLINNYFINNPFDNNNINVNYDEIIKVDGVENMNTIIYSDYTKLDIIEKKMNLLGSDFFDSSIVHRNSQMTIDFIEKHKDYKWNYCEIINDDNLLNKYINKMTTIVSNDNNTIKYLLDCIKKNNFNMTLFNKLESHYQRYILIYIACCNNNNTIYRLFDFSYFKNNITILYELIYYLINSNNSKLLEFILENVTNIDIDNFDFLLETAINLKLYNIVNILTKYDCLKRLM